MSEERVYLEKNQQLANSEILREGFRKLRPRQQRFLLERFPACQTDAEALLKLKGEVPARTLSAWKQKDGGFREVYDLMERGLVDVVAHLNVEEMQHASQLALQEAVDLMGQDWSQLLPELIKAKANLVIHFTGGRQKPAQVQPKAPSMQKIAKIVEE